MSTEYARNQQIPTGIVQARDLRDGDTILIRKPGQAERTPETIERAESGKYEVILHFDGWKHRLSPTMPVAFVAEGN